jgi:CHASE2 domain-containing sensor protein/predicted Ser/Thr protein kinase
MADNQLRGRYQLIQLLGEGGFAKTYLATDSQQNHRFCVIKHLTPANSSPQFLATARRLFKAEADVLRRLGSHDRIPALWDAFEADGEFYLVQEFIDGESLSEHFKTGPHYTEAQIIELLEEVLAILAFIHQDQVIHRDIKPSNLMRRHADGKLMLIDFGAVKEITTEFDTAGSQELTVSIGTQGYAAPEQMAGRPRYSSDLYALGMTAIRGLTGRSPTELPENPQTGELLWDTAAPEVGPGLKVFLQRLTHASIYQRYPSATAALADLHHLDTLAGSPTFDLPPTILDPYAPSPQSSWRRWLGSAIAPGLVAAVVLLIRQLGGWMPLELLIHDEWVQRQPEPEPDERILLVEITEADLKALRQPTPSDAILSQVIQTLQTHNPGVIGLDLYRNVPQGEGHTALLQALEANNVIAIRQLGSTASNAIPAPNSVPPERVGFNDFPVDSDGVVRRNLLFASTSNQADAEVFYSFALRLALAYLKTQDIEPLPSNVNPDFLALNGATFVPLKANFGGYRHVDDAGYQILMQYRAAEDVVPRLRLLDILEGQFTAEMIRDRIVLIGTTAPSAKDLFFTPYSEAADDEFLMPGVMLHAQATSQILSAALDGHRLPWDLPEAVEVGWVLLWTLAGGWLGSSGKRPRLIGIGLLGGGMILITASSIVFVAQGWLPLLPASVALVGSAIASALSHTYWPPPSKDSATVPTDAAPVLTLQK